MNAAIIGMFIIIVTPDLEANKQFYQTYFGFKPMAEMEWYLHMANEAGLQIAFMQPELSNQDPLFHPAWKGEGMILSLEVSDAQVEYNKLKQAGLTMASELKEESWGQIHFAVRDPNNIVIDVVQTINDPLKGNTGN